MTLSAAGNCLVVMPGGQQSLGLATLGSCFPLPVQQSSSEADAFRLGSGGEEITRANSAQMFVLLSQITLIAQKLPSLTQFHIHWPFSS